MDPSRGISLEEVNVFFGSILDKSFKISRVFFSTKLLSSSLVSLCFDNRSVMKNKPHSSTKAASCNRDGWGF